MTLIITDERFKPFKKYLEERGYIFEERPYQYFLARNEGFVINLYNNGKIVFGGKNDREKEIIQEFLTTLDAKEHVKKEREYSPIEITGMRIGTDEVGKGDYFGPLIIGGVTADETQIEQLQILGIKDSKSLSDTTIQNYAVKIKGILKKEQYEVITIRPLKYNLLHKQIGNVNGILGWGHARAIENLLLNSPNCDKAVADQFGDQSYIERSLMKQGKKIELIQTPKAERETSVAAASILARSEFIHRMREMNEIYGIQFPKGATDVIPVATDFVASYGSKALLNVAKVHFKTTQKIDNVSISELDAEPANKLDGAEPAETVEQKINRDILLECYNLISSFEPEFREFIAKNLGRHYGENWWTEAIKPDIRKKSESLCQKELQSGRKVELIDCLEMDHYRLIITDRANWANVFSNIFKDKEMFLARIKILKSVRNPVTHSRGTFGYQDRIDVVGSIKYFNRMISSSQK